MQMTRNRLDHGIWLRASCSWVWRLPRRAAVALFELYQATLSPDHGPLNALYPSGYCRHEPSCSMYAQRVLEERGFVTGSILTLRRVLSCHPWKKVDDEKVRVMLVKNSSQ